jgi:hypothetical protein
MGSAMRRKLGTFERAQVLTGDFAPFNVVAVLRVTGGPRPEVLRQACAALQRRQPLLGVHLVRQGDGFWFDSEGTPAIPVHVVERTGDTQWMAVAEEELNRGLDTTGGPLLRCSYLFAPQAPSEIVLTFHHVIVDAVSGVRMMHELLSLCDPTREPPTAEGGEVLEPLPVPESLFPPGFRGWRGRWRVALFLLRQLADEARFRWGGRGKRKAPIHAAARSRILPLQLSEEETTALARRARKEKVTLNSVVSAAILLAARELLYDGQSLPLRTFTFASLRPYIRPPISEEKLGSCFAIMRFTFRVGDQGFWELARQINEHVRTAGRRGDKLTFFLTTEMMMRAILRLRSMRMGTTAISYLGAPRLERAYGPLELYGLHTFVSNLALGPEYTALVRLFEGKLWWDILYLDADMGHARAVEMAEEIRATLHRAAHEEDRGATDH